MNKINRLDANLTNMIAAGEVVERPSGVVKELVENAIDAHADNIRIDIEQGGIELICVSDNGEGMSATDALMAFERHATSKIHEVHDLWKINSLGFRGEALPSIASVSKVHLLTNDSKQSSEVVIHYGKKIKAGPAAANPGTRIKVEHLFQKMPARFKHLKSPNYEFSLISEVVNRFALAYPQIAFTLNNHDKTVLQTNGSGDLKQVIMQINDRETAQAALNLSAQDRDYRLEGCIITPNISRSSKYYINLYINQRMIRSFKLTKAVIDAYHEFLPNDRYPLVFINIIMDPTLVDVNVHPSKWEVRLSKEQQLIDLLKNSIKATLSQQYQITPIKTKTADVVEPMRFAFTYQPLVSQPIKVEETAPKIFVTPVQSNEVDTTEYKPVEKPIVNEAVSALSQLVIIGQLHNAYIVCESPKGLVLIDQHAAQERYHYEQLQSALIGKPLVQSDLLIPLSIEVGMPAIAAAPAYLDKLAAIGLKLEVFGNTALVLRSIPSWMQDVDTKGFIRDLIDNYMEVETIDEAEMREKALASAACHMSIRFNRPLSRGEMQQVINDLMHCRQPLHCPHGRPTMIEYPLTQLEKDFMRVG